MTRPAGALALPSDASSRIAVLVLYAVAILRLLVGPIFSGVASFKLRSPKFLTHSFFRRQRPDPRFARDIHGVPTP